MTVNALLYKHYCYQDKVLEGNTDPDKAKSAYDRWANWCVITTLTPKYIRIELPNKTISRQNPISHYKDYEILNGLWVIVCDYDRDTEEFYYCRNWVQAILRKWICRVRCKGPYLIHIIDLKGVD